jgi:hypothetical protein
VLPSKLRANCISGSSGFATPLSLLRGSDERPGVGDIADTSVILDEGALQKHLTATVDADGLQMAEGIAHEIDGGGYLQPRPAVDAKMDS